MKLLIFITLTVLVFSDVWGVSTKYINDFRFDNIDNFTYSNISFPDTGGLELARATTEVYTSGRMIWSLAVHESSFLLGSGENASLYKVDNKTSSLVFQSTNHLLISDIQTDDKDILVSVFPKAAVIRLDSGFKVIKKADLPNDYVWEIVPANGGYYVLAGNPAQVYFLNAKLEIVQSWKVPSEDSILKGIYQQGGLYFSGDGSTLYFLDNKTKKVKAIYSFDNTIADLAGIGGKIYIALASTEIRKPQQNQQSDSPTDGDITSPISQGRDGDKRNRQITDKSSLYSYKDDGTLEKIFEKSGPRFVSLSILNGSLLVGTDKGAGYYEFGLSDNKRRFTSFGTGKIMKFIQLKDDVYAVMEEPSRILKILPEYAKKGYFESSIFDSATISLWGKPLITSSTPKGSDIKLYTHSGAAYLDSLWEDWEEAPGKIMSGPNRFFQYRVELTTDGASSPLFRSILVPYLQKNSAPSIDKINITYNNNLIKLSWEASDENKDLLAYFISLSTDDVNWVNITDKPLEENSMDIPRDNFPEGKYRARIIASDERSNNPADSRQSSKLSDIFTIDSRPPQIADIKFKSAGKNVTFFFSAADSLSSIFEASYCLNGGKWVRFQPKDGLFDSLNEDFEVVLPWNEPGFIEFRVSDIYGNYDTKGLSFSGSTGR